MARKVKRDDAEKVSQVLPGVTPAQRRQLVEIFRTFRRHYGEQIKKARNASNPRK